MAKLTAEELYRELVSTRVFIGGARRYIPGEYNIHTILSNANAKLALAITDIEITDDTICLVSKEGVNVNVDTLIDTLRKNKELTIEIRYEFFGDHTFKPEEMSIDIDRAERNISNIWFK